jgi:GT2 family glycosyltransferase
VGGRFGYEVLVMDHGSTDATAAVAAAGGASVETSRSGTIGALRNRGARKAQADLFVFLDADVSLAEDWAGEFGALRDALLAQPLVITGNRCIPDLASGGWVARAWFREATEDHAPTHLGSGHMVTTRTLFDRVGGFDETIATGEDYDLCQRARAAGAVVVARTALRAYHHGLPRSLREFVRREMWHSESDWQSFAAIARSKVALATLLFVGLLAGTVAGLLIPGGRTLALACVAGSALLCGTAALRRCGLAAPLRTLQCTVLYFGYFLGRALAGLRALLRGTKGRGSGAGR